MTKFIRKILGIEFALTTPMLRTQAICRDKNCRIATLIMGFVLSLAANACGYEIGGFDVSNASAVGRDSKPMHEHSNVMVDRVYLNQDLHRVSKNFTTHLGILQEKHGVVPVEVESKEFFLQDIGITLQDGRIAFPAFQQPAAIYAYIDAYILRNKLTGIGARFSKIPEAEMRARFTQHASKLSKTPFFTNIYFEGGNVLTTECGGRTVVLLGEDSVTMTMAYMKHRNGVSSSDIIEASQRYGMVENVETQLNRISFSQKERIRYERLSESNLLSHVEVSDFSDLSDYGGSAKQLWEQSIHQITDDSLSALQELKGRKQLALEAIAQTFSLQVSDIAVLPQAFYHIDLFTTAGPPGVVFLQNPERIAGGHPPLLVEQLRSAKERILDIGCDVVPAIGIVFPVERSFKSLIPLLNIFNGITGRGRTSGKSFFITNGWHRRYDVEGSLFRQMKKYDIDIVSVTHPFITTDCAGVGCFLFSDTQ